MARALILNATYQPLCVVDVRRALVLALKGKAEVLHTNGHVYRSAALEIAAPTVVRLNRYVRVPFRARASLSRRAVFIRDNFECQYCGHPAENVDHVVPRSRGGGHTWDNVVASCRPCNARKENRSPADVGLNLRRHPRPPHDSVWIMVAADRHLDPSWHPYLRLSGTSATVDFA
ncbi:MAG TPA: HNH endonuclease [Actinomycetota bacterium]|nr:HNH endonuclease [Actinomycetota bacterium]